MTNLLFIVFMIVSLQIHYDPVRLDAVSAHRRAAYRFKEIPNTFARAHCGSQILLLTAAIDVHGDQQLDVHVQCHVHVQRHVNKHVDQYVLLNVHVVVHGNAAFVGQGTTAECFNMMGLAGYTVGGISPFGQKRAVPTAIDAAPCTATRVWINAGQRGLLLGIAPADALRALHARATDLTA